MCMCVPVCRVYVCLCACMLYVCVFVCMRVFVFRAEFSVVYSHVGVGSEVILR
jgi:hypothetical protein